MAHSRQKKLDKMDIITKPKEKVKPVFGFQPSRTTGRIVFETNALVIGYGEPLCRPLHIIFERKKKIEIKGVKGLGTTTL